MYNNSYPSRPLCEVLEEMRKCYETRNFSYLSGLIEEAQSMGNRMEAGLEDKHGILYCHKEKRKAEKELKEVQAVLDYTKAKLKKIKGFKDSIIDVDPK